MLRQQVRSSPTRLHHLPGVGRGQVQARQPWLAWALKPGPGLTPGVRLRVRCLPWRQVCPQSGGLERQPGWKTRLVQGAADVQWAQAHGPVPVLQRAPPRRPR